MALALASSSFAFNAPVVNVPTRSHIEMTVAATGKALSEEWFDPVASHGSALYTGKKMNEIPFDPLNLASPENLNKYREAEIKHGRLAMLAALGWPAAEKLEPILAKFTGAADELAETAGRAPSLLNGGLEEAQIPYFLGAAFAIAGVADSKGTEIQQTKQLEPGNVGFDPLTLYPTDAPTQEKYKLAELKHGRIAMVAITLYALEEGVSGTSILKETVPLFSEIERLISEGPIQGNIDFFKDLLADANALETDVIKEEQFYGDAFTKPLFTRPTGTRDVQFSDILVGALPFFVAASASLNQGSKK